MKKTFIIKNYWFGLKNSWIDSFTVRMQFAIIEKITTIRKEGEIDGPFSRPGTFSAIECRNIQLKYQWKLSNMFSNINCDMCSRRDTSQPSSNAYISSTSSRCRLCEIYGIILMILCLLGIVREKGMEVRKK